MVGPAIAAAPPAFTTMPPLLPHDWTDTASILEPAEQDNEENQGGREGGGGGGALPWPLGGATAAGRLLMEQRLSESQINFLWFILLLCRAGSVKRPVPPPPKKKS